MTAARKSTPRPLASRPGWVISDGKAGMQIQVSGVAEALGLDARVVRVAPRLPWRLLSPWGPPDPRDAPGRTDGPMPPPFPAVALATGRLSIPAIRAIRRLSPQTLTVVIQDPRTGTGTADLIAVPAHDTLTGPNVIRTLTAPHGFSAEVLARLGKKLPAEIRALPRPRIAVILGGPNAVYRYTPDTCARLQAALAAMAAAGAAFLVTPSRRTPAEAVAAVDRATAASPRILWDGAGANPYPRFLASADAFVVTADSVNMTGEACATGKPVWVFEPEGGSPKFARFHEALRRYGATRALPASIGQLESWSYTPLDSAALIAREIERRWMARRARTPSGSQG
ncbi:MAG: mitochondrial fission ELM1 family protein [Hyphomicrobiales bacterium]